MVLSLERRPITPVKKQPDKDRFSRKSLNITPVTQVAEYYGKAIEAEHLKDPELAPYGVFKKVVSHLPGKIFEQNKLEALEMVKNEDPAINSIGKKAFQFLSLQTIFTVVDANLIKPNSEQETDIKETPDDMFNAALISVMENARSMNPNFPISNQVHVYAQLGVLSYLCETHRVPLRIHHPNLTGKKGIQLVRSIAELKGEIKNYTAEEIRILAQEISEEIRVPVDDFLHCLITEENSSTLEKADCPSYTTNEALDLKQDVRRALGALGEHNTKRRSEIIKLSFGIGNDGAEEKQAEIAERFDSNVGVVASEKIKGIRWLRTSPKAKKMLRNYC